MLYFPAKFRPDALSHEEGRCFDFDIKTITQSIDRRGSGFGRRSLWEYSHPLTGDMFRVHKNLSQYFTQTPLRAATAKSPFGTLNTDMEQYEPREPQIQMQL
eukprot:g31297.t1